MATSRVSKAVLERRAVRLADHLDRMGYQVADSLRRVDLAQHSLDTLELLVTSTVFKASGGLTPVLMRSFLEAATRRPPNTPLRFAKAPTGMLRDRAKEMAAKALLEGDTRYLEASEALAKDYVQRQVEYTQRAFRPPMAKLRLILSSNACDYCQKQVAQVAEEGFFRRHRGCACQVVER